MDGREVKGLDPSALDGFYGYGVWTRVGIDLIIKLDTQNHCVFVNNDLQVGHKFSQRRILGLGHDCSSWKRWRNQGEGRMLSNWNGIWVKTEK